jgi:hypothetical protein
LYRYFGKLFSFRLVSFENFTRITERELSEPAIHAVTLEGQFAGKTVEQHVDVGE